MPMTLTVSQVRAALHHADQVPPPAGIAPTTALLGQWFHECLEHLITNDSPTSPLAVLSSAEVELATWKALLIRATYDQFVGPRLLRHRVALQDNALQVAAFWKSLQEACSWLADLCWKVHATNRVRRRQVPAPWQSLAECFQTEQPLECVLTDPSWRDSVRLVGIADAVVRLQPTGVWCAIEFKTGSSSPVADLGQACLYHLLLSQIERSRTGASANSGSLALIRFTPERNETVFAAAQLVEAQQRLLNVIGLLAGVAGDHQSPARLNAPPAPVPTPTPAASRPIFGVPTATTDEAEHEEMGRKIVETFAEFGVDIELDPEIIAGPTFLRFAITPGSGTKVADVMKRASELQLRLQLSVEPFINLEGGRLVVDVQRPDRKIVDFDRIRGQLPPHDPRLGSANVPVGVDLKGQLICADLSQPEHCHLLVAGTTGSGKSEWLRMAIAGLMVTNTPETLRLVIIDPKRNAFHSLRNSPFLWQPLVFPDEQPAEKVLQKLCTEMDERYRLMNGADNIAQAAAKSQTSIPRIVCVCDEYRDLISRSTQQRKKIEAQICRLGAKARAAGIHLMLATQQPSRDTITGALDSNMPARVGLRMGKSLESRMMLGEGGAEKLLGHGDLLFRDVNPPRRLQAPLLSEANREQIFGDGVR